MNHANNGAYLLSSSRYNYLKEGQPYAFLRNTIRFELEPLVSPIEFKFIMFSGAHQSMPIQDGPQAYYAVAIFKDFLNSSCSGISVCPATGLQCCSFSFAARDF